MLTLITDWDDCRDLWLDTLERRCGSTRTRTEYARIHAAFFAAHPAVEPWEVNPTHAAAWAADLSRRLAPASVNKSLACLSSFYRFAARHYAHGLPLWPHANPFADDRLRVRVQRYAHARYPSEDQVRAILSVIDTSSPLGLRDLALFTGLVATTRRLNEWLNLRWSDITGSATSGCIITVRLKGGRPLRQHLPDGVLAQLTAWLQSAGHYPPGACDYVFTTLSRWDRPLNPGYVNQLLHRYCRLAGVVADFGPHGLRHFGARLRFREGATLQQLQQTLGHQNTATTEIYIRGVLSESEDAQAPALNAFIASLGRAPAGAKLLGSVPAGTPPADAGPSTAARMLSSRVPVPTSPLTPHPEDTTG